MNIAILIGSLSGGGAERVVCNLSNYLSDRHNVKIITVSNKIPTYQLKDSIDRINLTDSNDSSNYLMKNIKKIIRLRKYIKKSNNDIYIVMLPKTINLLLSQRKLIKAPIIVSERSDPKQKYGSSRIRKWLMKALYPSADAFVFQTSGAKNYYEKLNININESLIIPNAINKEFVNKNHLGKRKKAIVSVGRLNKQKNFQLLLDAFAEIVKKHEDYKLIIYGEGEELSVLIKKAENLGIFENVTFAGYSENIQDDVIDSALFVLPSNSEGMPNALIEAMGLGLPCISTDCPSGGPSFLIQNGENGILVPVNNKEEMSKAIDKVLSNNDLANKLGKNAKKINDTLNSERIYNQWEQFILKIANDYKGRL